MDPIIAYIPLGLFLGILVGTAIVKPDLKLIVTLVGDGIVAAIAYVISPEGIFGYGMGLLIGLFVGIVLKIILDRYEIKFESKEEFWNYRILIFFILLYSVIIILVIFVFPLI